MKEKWQPCVRVSVKTEQTSPLQMCRLCKEEASSRFLLCCPENYKIQPCKCRQPIHQLCLIKEINKMNHSRPHIINRSDSFDGFMVYRCYRCSGPILFKSDFSEELICPWKPKIDSICYSALVLLLIVVAEITLLSFLAIAFNRFCRYPQERGFYGILVLSLFILLVISWMVASHCLIWIRFYKDKSDQLETKQKLRQLKKKKENREQPTYNSGEEQVEEISIQIPSNNISKKQNILLTLF